MNSLKSFKSKLFGQKLDDQVNGGNDGENPEYTEEVMEIDTPVSSPNKQDQSDEKSTPAKESQQPAQEDQQPNKSTNPRVRVQEEYKTRTMVVSPACPPTMMRQEWSIEDFDIKRKLYEGAISRVILATDKRSGITTAVKVYKRIKLNDIERFQIGREIRMHSQLSHHAIIQFYAAWKDRDYVYIAIEWAPGGDVYNFLHKKGGKLPESTAVQIILEPFLRALNYLHENGLIHRDIKPENILLDSALNIKLSDFGLSIDQNQEIANTRLGTPDYLAPEILHCPVKQGPLENKENPNIGYDHRVDCWSVGVLAYELVVGQAPFNANSVGDTLRNIQSKDPKFVSFMSDQCIDFIKTCLNKNPNNRPDVKGLLQHPWVQMHSRKAPAEGYKSVGALSKYKSLNPERAQNEAEASPQPLTAKAKLQQYKSFQGA